MIKVTHVNQIKKGSIIYNEFGDKIEFLDDNLNYCFTPDDGLSIYFINTIKDIRKEIINQNRWLCKRQIKLEKL